MDSRKMLLIDLDNCVRCYSCQIACRQEHELDAGTETWCRVISLGPRRIANELHLDFFPSLCFQCDLPYCAEFCRTNALKKGDEGKVIIDEQACNGCRLCEYGCPYGNMSFNKIKGVVGKCDQCSNRVNYGLEPACVQHCIGGALQFVTPEELASITAGEHVLRMGMVYYTSSKWKLNSKE